MVFYDFVHFVFKRSFVCCIYLCALFLVNHIVFYWFSLYETNFAGIWGPKFCSLNRIDAFVRVLWLVPLN